MTVLTSGCGCISGKVFQAMEPVLLQHCSSRAGPLAWRGIIAAATVFAEAALDTASQNSSSSHVNSSQSAGTEAWEGPSTGANSPTSSACNPTMTSKFLAALPCVMALYSCHADPAAPSHTSDQRGELPKGLTAQLEPIIKLLKADPRLMLPFICALVSQSQQTVGQLSTSGGSHDQPSSQSLVQACYKNQQGVVNITAEHARQADAELGGSTADSAAMGGGARVTAAVETLLALCEEQVLLAHLLQLLQPLSEACSTLRYAVLASCNHAHRLAQDFCCCFIRKVQKCCSCVILPLIN